ncbi:aspartate kinase [Segetibacter sp. 3557_3]|uniref:aspartate kinase n=1 Tax=Segetibacter sp. 3557_3 TaxID=2547429 RepID=UPI001058AE5C|nr:aspartate kinase [Segetibacter sp. 3557_3]TDH28891.1 aspartate kinase [Segetibacter sp. 3557_3]
MKVYKFGGASLGSVDRIKQVGSILRQEQQTMVVVISAMGKTTNALEKVADAFYNGNQQDALNLFNLIKESHITTAKYLLVKTYNKTLDELESLFTEVEWLLHDKPVKEYDYYYDQVVCIGELLSSVIVNAYLQETGLNAQWLDVRDIIRTDDHFRDAQVDFEFTRDRLTPLLINASPTFYVTQGFIGSTDENESTTLGREGSDYSAAIFANLLGADNLTIWKDVEGVMNADPNKFTDAVLLPELSYAEVIEMSYYGAQVIHPKTIKPLQNKGIPLLVKSFINPALPGTVISKKNVKGLPPVKVIKENQVLLHLTSLDYSFVGEAPMIFLYNLFAELGLKPNLIQTGAIGVQVCMDDKPGKLDQVAVSASGVFDVQIEKGLSLYTVRHYANGGVNGVLEGRQVLLLQQTVDTVQYVYR